LIEEPEGKILLRRPKHRWEDNIRMYLKEIEWKGLDWMHNIPKLFIYRKLRQGIMFCLS